MTAAEYIQLELIDGIGDIVDQHKFLSFGLITSGIELLGICIDKSEDPFFHPNKSGERFRLAIQELFPEKYHQYNIRYKDNNVPDGKFDLYSELRCGLNHATFAKPKIGLSQRVHNINNLSVNNGKLTLVAEDFFDDFKKACVEVIRRIEKGEIRQRFSLHFG